MRAIKSSLLAAWIASGTTIGCAMVTQAPDFDKINMGMTKQEVIRSIGKPDSSSAQGGTEYLTYTEGKGTLSKVCFGCRDYYVRLINGRVESYGRSGDFDSAKVSETKSSIDLKVKDSRAPSPN